jgi:citrate lyase subunit beta / citryl-CoA lyase
MAPRSFLFVPGDSDRKLARSASAGADALIIDLEDAVAAENKAAARVRAGEFLRAHAGPRASQLWVRINPLDTAEAVADLEAVVGARPDGIMQPKIRSADDVIRLGQLLEDLEARSQLTKGSIRILPVATETPEVLFALGDFARCGARLLGLTWGAEDLSAAIGATDNRDSDGHWTQPYQLVRSLCLFGAGAAGVPAIDTVYVALRDAEGLRGECAAARRDGFVGKLAIHPDQVAIINECFLPSAHELAHATRVVELFTANPGVAALSLDGRMIDIPHLRQAQRILARAR